MICGRCGTPMVQGDFAMQKDGIGRKGGAFIYPVAVFYKDNEMICEADGESTLGYYCPECGLLIGVFPLTHPTGFAGKYHQDLDDKVDKLPKKSCPECGSEIDVDYPKCPVCGYIYEKI
ncbi:MAG: zinc ribbon domain-containing protein [Ruminococcus sp.]|nr:zinc ribbon domain-containing protein [Ruminococcus sp.]